MIGITTPLRPGSGVHRQHLRNMIARMIDPSDPKATARLIVEMAGRPPRGEDWVEHVTNRTIGSRLVLSELPGRAVAMCGPSSPSDQALVIVPPSYSEPEHRLGLAWALRAYVASGDPAWHVAARRSLRQPELRCAATKAGSSPRNRGQQFG